MCRFLLYLGSPLTLDKLITEPEHSLIRQSYGARLRREPLNGDGFGVAWYAHDISTEPARYRSIRPAWNDANLGDITRVSSSTVVLAHVRAASPGLIVSEPNCHPFTHGALAFMHNGSIGDFLASKRRIQRELSDEAFDGLLGSTDSEHAFALFRDRYRDRGAGVEGLADAVEETIRDIVGLTGASSEPSYLNFVVTDGECAVVTRFSSGESEPSLFMSRGREYECEDGVCRMVEPDDSGRTVIVASEPLADDDGWEEIPASSAVLIDRDRSATIRPLRTGE